MKRVRQAMRRALLEVAAVLPSRPVAPAEEQVRDEERQEDQAVRRVRLWSAMFPGLTREQLEDPAVRALLPWAPGREKRHRMAELAGQNLTDRMYTSEKKETTDDHEP